MAAQTSKLFAGLLDQCSVRLQIEVHAEKDKARRQYSPLRLTMITAC